MIALPSPHDVMQVLARVLTHLPETRIAGDLLAQVTAKQTDALMRFFGGEGLESVLAEPVRYAERFETDDLRGALLTEARGIPPTEPSGGTP